MLARLLCALLGHEPSGPVTPGDFTVENNSLRWIELPTYQCDRCRALLRWEEVNDHDITISRIL